MLLLRKQGDNFKMSDKKVPTGADGWPTGGADEQLVIQAVAKSLGVSDVSGEDSKSFVNMLRDVQVRVPVVDPDDDSLAGEASSSTSSVRHIDPKILRGYNWSPPLPWSTFLRLRRSWGQIKLSQQQEEHVFKALEKSQPGKIHDALPFVSAFIDKHCPELRHKNIAVPRPGATFLLLAVITGNVELCRRCLELGANPNSCKFLTDADAPDNQLRHGYSPMFLACICEQLEIMELLRQHGGSIHIIDRWGRTPLHAAAAMGSTDVLRWLTKEGAPRKVVDVDLQMPGELCVGKVIPALSQPSLLFLEPRKVAEGGEVEPMFCTCCRFRDDPVTAPGTSGSVSEKTDAVRSTKRKIGHCGCVDDMYTRWYADRLRSTWSTTFATARAMQARQQQQPQQAQPVPTE